MSYPYGGPYASNSLASFGNFAPTIPSARVSVKRFLLVETGTYNPQYRRGYETQVTGSVLNMIDERAQGSATLTPALFSGLAGQFVRPQAAPESSNPVNIPNGWGERRMRFMIEVEISNGMGVTTVEMLTGYTENFDGVSISGHIDPNLMFFINGISTLRRTVVPTPTGNQMLTNVAESSQLLVDNTYGGVMKDLGYTTKMRPTDVYSLISRSHLPRNPDMRDGRTVLTTQTVKSRRSNNLPTSYATSLINGYTESFNKNSDFGQSNEQILSDARGGVAVEPMAAQDAFLQAMSSVRCMPVGNLFTFADLLTLDPRANDPTVKQIFFLGQNQRITPHYAGQSEGWQGADRMTAAAAILSQAVPAILADLGLTQCAFQASNRNFGLNVTGVIPTNVTVMNIRSFANTDLSQQGMAFESRLVHEVLADISYNNAIDYFLEMDADLLGESKIRLSLDGGPFIDYVMPSFCDALTTPVLTNNEDKALVLANDFGQIFEHVTSGNGYGVHSEGFGRF